ncbi:hypothetical protein CAPTEDRAFT_185657 [Capitella teleta]|uniref:Uncharacterized protein n=1 Tax=Capitella teleta TaxID=283909 RepID=R7UQ36_CAPTE|nr:hypothetical protein CAPTEDRAFT_185657 [Capitella teleta]|eukprot:ELU05531.1 hypothetical protein CAPTEDRAFT_185657 [Capitella teleta]
MSNLVEMLSDCQLLRLRKLTTEDDDYEDCSTQMMCYKQLKANQHTQQTLLQNSKNATTAPYQIPFVTTYHPEINKIHNILKKNWTILLSTSKFGDCPPLSLRNNANLKKLLVRSNIHDERELAGTFLFTIEKRAPCEGVVSSFDLI